MKPRRPIGESPEGGSHYVDQVVTRTNGTRFLLSVKWQAERGTVDQKIPYEAIRLGHILATTQSLYDCAYIVIGGKGWKPQLKAYYIENHLDDWLRNCEQVHILDLDGFHQKAQEKTL